MRRWYLLFAFGAVAPLACDATGTVTGGAPLLADPCAATNGASTWSALYTCYFGPSGRASCASQSNCHGSPQQSGATYSGFVCSTASGSEACWRSMTQCAVGDAGPGDAGPEGEEGAVDAPFEAAGDAGIGDAGIGDGAIADARPEASADAATDAPPDAGVDASEADAGDDASSVCGCSATYLPIAESTTMCGSTDPTQTRLWSVLRGANGALCPSPPMASNILCMPYDTSGSGYTFSKDDLARISTWLQNGAPFN